MRRVYLDYASTSQGDAHVLMTHAATRLSMLSWFASPVCYQITNMLFAGNQNVIPIIDFLIDHR
ncbi:hypothetical protein [Solitalea longa]|uniref:hypothetical protein n=1 Tax=Solitalea longa TaxID=2079460 RepID=UPI0013FDC57D|nr:hypothetical protein [Solitalea longa]